MAGKTRVEQAVPPVQSSKDGQAKLPVPPSGNDRFQKLCGIGRFRLPLFVLLVTFSLSAQTDPPPWFVTIAKLASALSQNNSGSAMETFDSRSKDYGTIENNIGALVSQADVLCSIDPIEDRESGDLHEIDTDWYLELKSQADFGPTERRRERVHLQLKKVGGRWKISALSPLTILAPIRIL